MERLNEGQQKAKQFLIELKAEFQQIDWLVKINSKYIKFEIKEKEQFNAPPFDGMGLNEGQRIMSNKLYNDLNIRTFLLVFNKTDNEVYGQYLDILDKDISFLTFNKIRIYPLKNFIKGKENIKRLFLSIEIK